jgi:hypothetical protein
MERVEGAFLRKSQGRQLRDALVHACATRHPSQHIFMQEIVIETGRTERHPWRDLWPFQELFSLLAWRGIRFIRSLERTFAAAL